MVYFGDIITLTTGIVSVVAVLHLRHCQALPLMVWACRWTIAKRLA
jgi:hypothetical protein